MHRSILTALLVSLTCVLISCNTQDAQLPTVAVNGGGIDGFLEYEEHGSPDGEPVILIQGTVVADAFLPIANEAALSGYRVLRVHLRGYAGSSTVEAPFGAIEHAEDMVAFARALGIDRAHFVGHSYGGAIAMQVAIAAPEMVHSLVLAEPGRSLGVLALMLPADEPRSSIEELRQVQLRRIDSFPGTLEQKREWLDNFLTGCLGNLEALRVIPDAYEQALTNGVDAFRIQTEYPIDRDSGGYTSAMGNFDPEIHLPQLPQPILFLRGADPRWEAMAELFREYGVDTEFYSFAGAPHCFTILQPAEVADVIADFLSRNSM